MHKRLKGGLAAVATLLLIVGAHTIEAHGPKGHQAKNVDTKGIDTPAQSLDTPAHPPAKKSRKRLPWRGNYFPNGELTNHDGKTVRFYDDLLKDKAVVLHFFYTSCDDTCPLVLAKLAKVQELLGDRVGDDIFMYSISVDPERDTLEVIKAYREKFHVKPGWDFFSGNIDDINLVRLKLGLYTDEFAASIDLSLSIILGIEPMGRWRNHTSTDNPHFLAGIIGDWLHNWKKRRVTPNYADAPGAVAYSKGHYLFYARCATCHTIGKGDGIGPDLMGVTENRDRKWLIRWLRAPDKMLAERDPIAMDLFYKFKQVPMPNLRLSQEDVLALMDYMEKASHAGEAIEQQGGGSGNGSDQPHGSEINAAR
jgi:protein SCO1/2